MKQFFYTLIFTVLVIQGGISQNSLLSIGGFVIDETTGTGVVDHIVTAEIMSAGFVEAFDMVTNNSGFYGDSIPVFGNGIAIIFTFDCNGNMHTDSTVFSPENLSVNSDFVICTDSIPNGCTASFDYFLPPQGGNVVTFINLSSGNPTSWLWDFGDGSTSAEWEPLHEFGDAGIYPVCLTIWSDSTNCFDIFCMDVVTGNGGGGECENFFYFETLDGYTFNFTGEGNPPASDYFWDFGDGSTGYGQNVQFTYEPGNTGPVTVSLTTIHTIAGTADTCIANSSQIVIVGDSLGDCENYFFHYPVGDLTYHFTGEAFPFPAETFSWDFGDGQTATGEEVEHTFDPTMGDFFIVTLTTIGYTPAGDTCVATSSQEVWISNNGDCTNWFWYETWDFVSFYFSGEAEPYPADQYYWDLGDGTTATGQEVGHTYSGNPGDIVMVTLTTVAYDPATGDSCLATSIQEILLGGQGGVTIMGSVFADEQPASLTLVGLFSADPDIFFYEYTLTQDSGMYFFENIPEGDYYLFATPTPQSPYSYDYFPTYYGDAIFWFDAGLISLGEPANPYDIHLVPITGSSSGPGSINGVVTMDDGKEGLAETIMIMLMDAGENAMDYTSAGENGNFSFANLAYGTYKLRVEMPGVTSETAVVELSEDNLTAAIQFYVHNNTAVLGVDDPLSMVSMIGDVYPNPAGSLAKLNINVAQRTDVVVRVINQTGELVASFPRSLERGLQVLEIESSSLAPGLYYVQIIGSSGNSMTRKLIK